MDTLYQTLMSVLSTAFYDDLLKTDKDRADQVQKAGCPHCGGKLHAHHRLRKAAGLPQTLGDEHRVRFAFRCGRRSCRKHVSPDSVRFQGRKLYLGVVMALLTAKQCGLTVSGETLTAIGVSRRTLGRWRQWWQKRVPETSFWREKMGKFRAPVNTATLPASLLRQRVGEKIEDQLIWLLRFIAPLGCDAAFRQKAA